MLDVGVGREGLVSVFDVAGGLLPKSSSMKVWFVLV